jgi:hypothetical protein
MKTTKTIQPNRRKFLLAAGASSAGVAAAVVVGTRKPEVKAEAAGAQAQPSGYHASEHIQKYYKTTEV